MISACKHVVSNSDRKIIKSDNAFFKLSRCIFMKLLMTLLKIKEFLRISKDVGVKQLQEEAKRFLISDESIRDHLRCCLV